MTPDMMTIAIAGLAFIAITAVGFVFAGGDRGKQTKRIKTISDGSRVRVGDTGAAARRKQMDVTTKALRDREEANRKRRTVGRSIEDRIKQSGLNITMPMFWIGSAVSGVAAAGGMFFGAGFNEGMMMLVPLGIGFAAIWATCCAVQREAE